MSGDPVPGVAGKPFVATFHATSYGQLVKVSTIVYANDERSAEDTIRVLYSGVKRLTISNVSKD